MAENETANGRGDSVSDRAENDDQTQQEMFPAGVLDGDKLTPSTITRGKPTHLEAEMTTHRVDLRNGLLDPDKLIRYAVTVRPGQFTPTPVREKQPDGEMKTTSWTIVQKLKPVYMEPLGMGAEALARQFEMQLGANAQEAGRALDLMTERFAEYQRDGQVAA